MTPQDYETWRRHRAGCITASEAKTVVGGGPKAWRTLLGKIRTEKAEIDAGIFRESAQCAATDWGKQWEPVAIAAYTMKTGRAVEPAPFERMFGLPIGASPDGYVGLDGNLEVKCPYSAGGYDAAGVYHPSGFERYLEGGYESAKPQVQFQLWVTDRKWCDFIAFDPRRPEDDRIFIQRVERDEPYILDLANKAVRFAAFLVAGTDPEGTRWHDPMTASETITLF